MIDKATLWYPLIQPIEYRPPVSLFAQFAEEHGAIFFDSAELRAQCGRYSFIAIDPFLTLSSKNGVVTLNNQSFPGDPFQLLKDQLARFVCGRHPELPPFQGGAAGLFSYDLYQHLENIPLHPRDDMQFPDMALGFYDVVIAFDHVLQRAWIFSSGFPLRETAEREKRAQERLRWLEERITTATKGGAACVNFTAPIMEDQAIHANFTAEQYEQAVQKTMDYILAGDVFEACISQRFSAFVPETFRAFDLYYRLRTLNPAPFAAYFKFADTIIASASPERFLKLAEGLVESRPIKGTCGRGQTQETDAAYARQLLRSEKDRAENIMIVDLLRNDLSRVCEDHSVQVPQLCGLETYSTVHHLVSVITGKLHSHICAVDLLQVTFPGGSITGAPKIRAMEIIAELEPTPRGPYCGSLGYIGFNGDMDSSIVIRTYAIKHNRLTFQAGGAVVADSNPRLEYEETLIKANALRRALTHGFIDR